MRATVRTMYALGWCLVLCIAAPLRADESAPTQQEALPSVDDVINKYVEVTGGRAKYDQLKNIYSKGSVEFPAMGMSGSVQTYSEAPNKMVQIIEFENMGKVMTGTDGSVFWESSAMQGPRIYEGPEKVAAMRESTFNGILKWKELYASGETVAVETVGEEACYKVVLKPAEGHPETLFFSKSTGLMVRKEQIATTAMGDIPTESQFLDYQEAGGIKTPHKVQVKTMYNQVVFKVEKLEHNIEIPAGRFDLPEDIQGLIAKQKSKQEAPQPAG